MSRTQVALLVVLLLAAALVLVLAFRNPQAPVLPGDPEHARHAVAQNCLEPCHGADDPLPRSTNHPLGADCYRCHGRD